jgi:hypothetical protein
MQKKQSDRKLSKADFVRSMPNASTADIIAAGKKQGIVLTSANVHATRYQDKANGHKPKKGNGHKKAVKKLSKKAPRSVLAKYPNIRKSNGDGAFADQLASHVLQSQAMTGLMSGLQAMVKLSVREELRAILGNVQN